jgi:hypothetical protein
MATIMVDDRSAQATPTAAPQSNDRKALEGKRGTARLRPVG